MKKYSIDKQGLWDILEAWDPFMPRKVRLVACGGTALTLQDLKDSTKDVDFLVPDMDEYKALLSTIQRLNYRQATGSGWAKDDGLVFDLFRGTDVDVQDCARLIRGRKTFDWEKFKERYKETALYEMNPEKMMKNLEYLLADFKEG
mgnify:CR=1 FL=1